MTLQKYVTNVLQIPPTRLGNRQFVMSMELILDKSYEGVVAWLYPRLSEVTGKTGSQLEHSLRAAKRISLAKMEPDVKQSVIGDNSHPGTIEFIILATQAYKEKYENKD